MSRFVYIIFACVLSCFSAQAATFHFFTENLRPFNYLENDHLTGISVELIRLVWQEMGVAEQPIKLRNWEDAYYLLQHRPNTALFLTMRSPNREQQFLWACPITQSTVELIALSDKRLDNIDLNSKQIRYGAMKSSVGEQLLLHEGVNYEQITTAESFEKILRLLERERVDVIVSEPVSVEKTAKALGFDPNRFTAVYNLSELQGCYAFNQYSEPEYVERFQQALSKITASPAYQALLVKYQLVEQTPK